MSPIKSAGFIVLFIIRLIINCFKRFTNILNSIQKTCKRKSISWWIQLNPIKNFIFERSKERQTEKQREEQVSGHKNKNKSHLNGEEIYGGEGD